MKKLLALMLALLFTFAVVGCGGAGNDKDGDSSKGNGTSQSGSSDKESSNPYVGTWHHERTDDEPVDKLTQGRKNLTSVEWKENEDGTISLTIHFPDGTTKDSTARLTDDGNLFWDYSFKVQTTSGDIVELDNLTFKKE